MLHTLLPLLWRDMLVATGVMIAGTGLGWWVGRSGMVGRIGFVNWWVRHVAMGLLRQRSWFKRTVGIFLNNTVVLAAVMVMGAGPHTAWIAVAALGASLGVGLRILSETLSDASWRTADGDDRAQWRNRLGFALNMLEPPAIVLTLGLSVGQQKLPGSAGQAWLIFSTWVIPALLAAAAGEAVWLGTLGLSQRRTESALP